MGDRSTRSGAPLGRRRVAGAAAVLTLIALSGTAAGQRSPAPRDAGGRGAIVQHEESRGTGILYLEESGGLVTRVAAPVAVEGDEATAPAAGRPLRATATARAAPRRAPKARAVTPGVKP